MKLLPLLLQNSVIVLFLFVYSSLHAHSYTISKPFQLEDTLQTTIPLRTSLNEPKKFKQEKIILSQKQPIYGAGITATIQLFGPASFIRVVFVDTQLNNYLLYETFPLLAEGSSFSVEQACRETKLLNRTTPLFLYVQVYDAAIDLKSISYRETIQLNTLEIKDIRTSIHTIQHNHVLHILNAHIQKRGLRWTAGSTALSLKSYAEKKSILAYGDSLPQCLHGFEYYTGGIFSAPSFFVQRNTPIRSSPHHAVVDSFDWRNRHGATNDKSAYYDGDTLQGGWATSIKNQYVPQSCYSCWAHSTIATAEMAVNLYYNRHIDLNLSEQFLMSCSCSLTCEKPGLPCSGGLSSAAAQWVAEKGVTDEENFPYKASNDPLCQDSGQTPREHLRFTKGIYLSSIPSEDSLKQLLIHYGPINIYITSMWHCMSLVGYTKDSQTDETIWIYKNSFGIESGEKGYSFLKTSMPDIKTADVFIGPPKSLIYTQDSIRCVDLDKDGFYNWGIGSKPRTCPQESSDEKDCDDSRNDQGPFLPTGACKEIIISILPFNQLSQNIKLKYAPNPFKHSIVIQCKIPKQATATVAIYTCSGKLLAHKAFESYDGTHQVRWNGTDTKGMVIPKGMYIGKLLIKASPSAHTVCSHFKIIKS